MEFTISRRVRRRGAGMLCAAAVITAGLVAWLISGKGHGVGGPLVAAGAAALCAGRGLWELRRARQPFRLRVDAFGLTLHDAELSWEQIESVALRYTSAGDSESAPPRPHLTVWPAPGTKLPREPDRTWDGRVCHTLLDTDDLDQPLGQLAAALAEHGGARFETAPRAVRLPTPVTVAGPEHRVPGGDHVFRTPGPPTALLLVCLVLALAGTTPFAAAATGRTDLVPLVLLGPLVPVAAVGWVGTFYWLSRRRRPPRLTVGPGGIAFRDYGKAEVHFSWPEVAAITVGPRGGSTDTRPWLIVWPLPGASLPSHLTPHLADGHLACHLAPLHTLPGGPAALPAVHAFAGERFSGPTTH
ncbi:hypothetical protein [Streptomyces sp. NRRL F-5123]|uniref:hypothetical protein n=1 Tax=Streptomyces sp. NRRL F-5123 TaxID=1463856 RepID=UPI0004E13361|nr:hypothetical protein [Streptomyces sp. NRRL F-5123]